MKKEIVKGLIKFGLLIALVTFLSGQATQAQTLEYGLRANIPFDFTVGTKTLPAGHYSFKRGQTSDDLLLRVNSLKGNSGTYRITVPVTTLKAKDKSTLVFHRYGNQYFLSQVWPAGASTGRSLPPSREERELQRKQNDSTLMSTNRNEESQVVYVVADLP